ncbi:MAG: replicative DNA helicase [Planctomycetes bacterium]|nr:replicative DNA helicase [Planctomycetota bacterium]
MAASRGDIFDKLPPQNLDAERSVLGSMLLSQDAIDEAADLLEARHFYSDSHQRVCSAIYRLYENGSGGIDAVTVAEELERHADLAEIGGPAYLAQLLEAPPLTAHARYYANIVREKFVLRTLREACTQILRDISDEPDDAADLLAHAEQRIFSILEQQGDNERMEIREILMAAFDGITSRSKESLSGLATGFCDLDAITTGLHPSQLVILAARPSIGKTAFVCNIVLAVAQNAQKRFLEAGGAKARAPREGVLLFSLEQSSLELAERLLCIKARVDGHRLRRGELEDDERDRLLAASSTVSELPLFIDDTPGRSMAQISAIARRTKRRHGLGLIVLDYLQLIEPEDRKAPREQQVAQIARRLKFLAKEIAVPVVALAQLNRGVDLRTDKRPKLADLRESGAIEQDADLVMFLHREDAYDPTPENQGLAELIVAKHRNGPTGLVPLTWIKESMRFENRSRLDEPEGGWIPTSHAGDGF